MTRWEGLNEHNIAYNSGMLNAIGSLENIVDSINFDELEKYPATESIQLLKIIKLKIDEIHKQANNSAHQIAEEIAKEHRGVSYTPYAVESAPHIGVIWVDAEWFNEQPCYWMVGQILPGKINKIVKLPPITETQINLLINELVKVRYQDIKLKDWWAKIKTWINNSDLIYPTVEDGIWKLYWNHRKRELFNQSFEWIVADLLPRIELIAVGKLKHEDVWFWLDGSEKKYAIKEVKNNQTIALKCEELKSGCLRWRVYYNGKYYYIPRYKLLNIYNDIKNNHWQPPN